MGWGCLALGLRVGRFGSCCLEGGDASRRHGYRGLVFLSDSHTRSAFGGEHCNKGLDRPKHPPAPRGVWRYPSRCLPSAVVQETVQTRRSRLRSRTEDGNLQAPKSKQSQALSKFHGVLLRHPILHPRHPKGVLPLIPGPGQTSTAGFFWHDGSTHGRYAVGTRVCDVGVSVADARGSGCRIRRSPLFRCQHLAQITTLSGHGRPRRCTARWMRRPSRPMD